MNDNLTNQPLSLAYTCRGSGPDLLLVHGFASSVRNWDALIPALEADFRCWAVDLPGFGDTCIDAEREVTLDEHVAHLLRFVETHDLHPQAIIGHSMGGMLTLKLAVAEPSLASNWCSSRPP